MNLLAIETSTERLSIAILRDGVPFARDIDAGQRHSELAMPLLHELLAEAGVTLRDVDTIAFRQGPGSFTGVRIAYGLTQGLALNIGRLLVPVPTQMALAAQTGAARVIVAIDARMGEIYFAAYLRDTASAGKQGGSAGSDWQEVVAPMLVKPDALPPLDGDGWTAVGSGFDVPALCSQLSARYGSQIVKVMHGVLPRAIDVALIAAWQLATTGLASAIAPEHAAPLYLRNKVAMTIDERREHHAAKSGATPS